MYDIIISPHDIREGLYGRSDLGIEFFFLKIINRYTITDTSKIKLIV